MSVCRIFIAHDPEEVGNDSDQGEKSDLNGKNQVRGGDEEEVGAPGHVANGKLVTRIM